MFIDKNPTIDSDNRTFTVSEDSIAEDSEIVIYINGLIGIANDDIIDVTDNVITIAEDLDIDYSNDSFVIFYD